MRCRGFTLVELLLALVILGILAGAAVTTQSTDDHELDAAAHLVTADLLQAQQLAIAHRMPIGLSFDDTRAGTTFVLADGTALATAETPLRSRGDLTTQEVDRLVTMRPRTADGSGDVAFGADFVGDTMVMFTAQGTPSAGGTVTLQLGASTLRVRCAPITGRIAITAP